VARSAGQAADFKIDDADVWELKSPESPIRNNVMRRITKGRGQSANIVLNLARTSIPTEDARALAENIVGRYVDIKRIWLIGRIEAGQPLTEIVGEEGPDAGR
jgi:Contact-dependent growth inhibition CdiA C-terminal domain